MDADISATITTSTSSGNMETLDGKQPSPRYFSKKHDGTSYRLLFATICAYLGPFSFGYVIGYSSPAIPQLEKEGFLVGQQVGWFGSLMTVGAMLGSLLGGWCIEKFGRKGTIHITSIPFIIGWSCIAVANGPQSLFTGRFFCGIASGLITVCAPVYVAEISTTSLRGTLGAGNQLSITIGILVAYSAGLSLSWVQMAVLGMAPAFITIIALCSIPESPRWLLMHEQRLEAIRSLRQLRNQHADVEDECRDIEEGLDVKEVFSWSEFKKPELSRPLIISMIIMAFQQLSGINAVMFYTVSIFKNAGVENSGTATVLIGAVQVVATLVACMLMDKIGRRKLLVTAGTIMSLACFVFGFYYYKISTGSRPADLGMLAVISLVVYIIGFSLGWGPIPMLIMSEIFPARARGAASGLAVLTNWTFAFIVTKEFIYVQEMFGPDITFWMFSVSCFCSVIYVWKRVPETKGKSLEDIELFFLGKSMLYV